MKIFSRIRAWLARRRPRRLEQWFIVSFDDQKVEIRAAPPGRESWEAEFPWSSITRICFEATDFMTSDGIYVFTTLRPESYAIPTEARGGQALWNEILRRGLFDADLAIVAAGSPGGLYC